MQYAGRVCFFMAVTTTAAGTILCAFMRMKKGNILLQEVCGVVKKKRQSHRQRQRQQQRAQAFYYTYMCINQLVVSYIKKS